MSETSSIYTPSRESIIESAMDGNIRFCFDGEDEIKHYEFVFRTDGQWIINVIEMSGGWSNYVESEFDDLEWASCEEALDAKIFDGKSLLDLLDKVTFY